MHLFIKTVQTYFAQGTEMAKAGPELKHSSGGVTGNKNAEWDWLASQSMSEVEECMVRVINARLLKWGVYLSLVA
jgi:hypothetical protein